MGLSTDILQPKKRKNKGCTKIKALNTYKKTGKIPEYRQGKEKNTVKGTF
jgi:hypothetical protein